MGHEARCPRFLPLAFSSTNFRFLVCSPGWRLLEIPNWAVCKPKGKRTSEKARARLLPGYQPFLLSSVNLPASTPLTEVTGGTVVAGVAVGMGSGGPSGGVLPDSSASALDRGSSVVAATKSSSLGPWKQNPQKESM